MILSTDSFEERRRDKYNKIFNQYFICNKPNAINSIYTKCDKEAVWSHPLLLNYNHCLFCREYSKSPYSLSFLYESHITVPNLYQYFASKGINFNYPETRKIQRLIHSYDSKTLTIKSKGNSNQKNKRSTSDTDIFFNTNTTNIKSKGKKHNDKHKDKDKDKVTCLSAKLCHSKIIDLKEGNNSKSNSSCDSLIQNKGYIKTDNVNLKLYHRKKSSKKSDTQIMSYLNPYNNDIDNESFSLTQYNNDISLDINNPLYQSFQEENKIDSNFINNYNKRKQDTCEICFQQPNNKIVLDCGDIYCKDCLRTYILSCINNISQFNNLYCPKEICKHKLIDSDYQILLSNDEMVKYLTIKTRIAGLSNPFLIPCPFPDCESYAKINKPLLKKRKCKIYKCNNDHNFCSKCLLIIKDNKIDEHKCISTKDKMKDETIKYLSTNRNIKKCPNCHCYVQRELDNKGCNNMTCTNPWCGYQFCWICEKKYDAYHYRNPFTPCFGLSETDLESKQVRYKIMRVGKCFLIFLLLILIALPICLALFSLIAVTIYVVAFVIDGSLITPIQLKSKSKRKVFNIFMYMFFALYAIAFIPLGYIVFALSIIALPLYCFIQRRIQIKEDANSE